MTCGNGCLIKNKLKINYGKTEFQIIGLKQLQKLNPCHVSVSTVNN